MTLDLLAIGEAMAELRMNVQGEFAVGFAGDTFNTAVYCSRLRGRKGIGFLTRVGSDPLSRSFVDLAEEEGLPRQFISTDKSRNIGIYSISTDGAGERSFDYWREASAARQLFASDEHNDLPQAKIYYLSGITLAILSPDARQRLISSLRKQVEDHSTLIAFDSNYRPKLWESAKIAREVISQMWDIADIALPSIDDEQALFDESSEQETIDRFSRKKWKACAIKRGVEGPLSLSLPPEKSPAFPPAENVVDTTAAGDSFNGGYLAAYLNGDREELCLQSAHEMASMVVQQAGAIVSETP